MSEASAASQRDAQLLEARQLLQMGRAADAARLYESVLALDPQNIEALNVVGVSLVSSGDDARGLEFLARATKLAPDAFVARLYRGRAHERLGDPDAALRQYLRAIKTAQAAGQWRNAATTSPGLRPLVEHALGFVMQGRRALYGRIFDRLASRFGDADLGRVRECLQVYLGERTAQTADARQRPRDLYFPGLPTTPYFDRALFAWAEALQSHTSAIRDELRAVMEGGAGAEAVFADEKLARENLQGASPKWDGYYFYRHGHRRDDNCERCPRTTQALDCVPLMRVRDLGPEVMFSFLAPGTHLLPHHGVTNARIVVHLPLIVPSDCALRVGGELHAWREGELVFFDDTYEHEAWNRSGEMRVVLIMDCWNPHLTEVERAAAHDLMAAIGDFDRASAADD
jgi:aspartate beta-hydroxylase